MKPQSTPPRTALAVIAYPPGWRWLAAGLFALSRFSLVVIAFMLLIGWVISPPLLVRLIVLLALAPGLLLVLLRALFAAECEVSKNSLSLRASGWYRPGPIRVGLADIQSLKHWSLPTPGSGLSIRFTEQSGARDLTLETRHSAALIAALPRDSSTRASRIAQATGLYSEAKADSRVARWHWPMFKFGLFGLLPVLVVFRLHQNITYGGLFGQYYLHGPGPWLSSLTYHWIMVTIYLVLYAAFWRAWIEAACWLSARFAPGRAGTVRIFGEIVALAVYFAGIPALIVWRSFF